MKLYQSSITTPLGNMITITDQDKLYLLEFTDRKNLSREMERIKKTYTVVEGNTPATQSIAQELNAYFYGTLHAFKTPYTFIGTPFQQRVWHALTNIDYAHTQSYAVLAQAIGNPKAFRAAALANSMNQLCIIIPCHRVINSDGKLGGYGAGIERKQWLLAHEQKHR